MMQKLNNNIIIPNSTDKVSNSTGVLRRISKHCIVRSEEKIVGRCDLRNRRKRLLS